MSSISSYKDLLIWKKGIVLVVKVYQLTKAFPTEELYALTSQIKRASVSIPSNIAESLHATAKAFRRDLTMYAGNFSAIASFMRFSA